MKRALVEGTFPELKGGFIYKNGRGEGSNSKAAISRAFGDLLKQVKNKRVSIIKATVTLIEITQCDICGYEVCRCVEVEKK